MNYWLMKSEPDVYSIDHLERDRKSLWDGVRNYQARNFLKSMQVDDLVFFYHSNTKSPGIVGLAKVCSQLVVDPTQFDSKSDYFDPKATPNSPRWHTVEVEFVEKFFHSLSLEQLRQHFQPEALMVIRKGNRLSVMPVDAAIATQILDLARGAVVL